MVEELAAQKQQHEAKEAEWEAEVRRQGRAGKDGNGEAV